MMRFASLCVSFKAISTASYGTRREVFSSDCKWCGRAARPFPAACNEDKPDSREVKRNKGTRSLKSHEKIMVHFDLGIIVGWLRLMEI